MISRKAAGPEKIVLGSVGPTGKILMMGDVTEEELYDAFKEQAVALEEGGADAIVVETMTDLDEARIAVEAAKENTGCEVICTMTFDKIKSGEFRTMMGIAPGEIPEVLIAAGASVIGANCGNGIAGMVDIVREIRSVNSEIPILVHANAGLPVYSEGKTVFPETPDEMASLVEAIIGAGATIIGGCCGTTPAHICNLRSKVDSLKLH
jgi:5-methyltetrahydrofolate--homocysteine methyltransferase